MWQLIVDGMAWVDSDGSSMWPYEEAVSLAAMLESIGYEDIEFVEV